MRIYRFWKTRKLEIDGSTFYFKAGSNESEEHADSILDRKVEYCKEWIYGEPSNEKIAEMDALFADRKEGMEYEVPICEELLETVDEYNIITRNRYGAAVLNSENHTILDIDPLPCTIGQWFLSLFGKKRPEPKAEILAMLDNLLAGSEFKGIGVRVYETAKGIRVILSVTLFPAYSYAAQKVMYSFQVDKLYATLCAKQNCYRARLTPKPARMNMKTALKFKFPYDNATAEDRKAWLAEYEKKSEDFATCHLIRKYGEDFMTSIIELHDKVCKVESKLPLA